MISPYDLNTLLSMSGFDYLSEFLKEEGYRFKEEDHWISFKINGVNFVAFKNDNNPFVQIVCMCSIKPENQNRMKLLELCNKMNQDKFVVKFTLSDDMSSIWASYEFEPNTATVPNDYMAAFNILDKSTDEFFEKLSN